MIATDNQVERGINEALQRVTSKGVFIEGNSFSKYVAVDAMIMTIRESRREIKRSAKDALLNASSLYVWRDINPDFQPSHIVATMLSGSDELLARVGKLPYYTAESFSDLVASLRKLEHSLVA